MLRTDYFLYTQSLSLTVFAILFGLTIVFTRRYKWYLVAGVCIRVIGVGCMIAARDGSGKTAGLILTQIVQGIGGGAFCGSSIKSLSHARVQAFSPLADSWRLKLPFRTVIWQWRPP
jgi:hypothetical protein